MRTCLLCEQEFTPPVQFAQLFSFKPARKNKICLQCLKQFEKLADNRCSGCDKELSQGFMCSDCRNWQAIYGKNILHNHALYRYNSAFHDLMVAYKRRGDYVLREVLQDLCYDYLCKTNYDFYVPVPTSPEHQSRRQFDTIFAIYADILPLTPLLIKQSGSHAQGEKNKEERLKTPQSFLIDKNIKIKENIVSGKVLILDDIYTTGRTLYHARDCLQQGFPEMKIESFSICHQICYETLSFFWYNVSIKKNRIAVKGESYMLKYNVRGENIEVTDALRSYVEKRLNKLEKYFELNQDVIAHVNLRVYRDRSAKVEVTIPLPYLVLRAEETTDDMYRSIDFVSEKLERQIRKYKTRVNRKSREKGLQDFFVEQPEEEKKPSEFDIVRNKRVSLKPMDPEEAILQMDMLEHDFFVFEDAETNGTSVVYRRNDGRYGLIETNE